MRSEIILKATALTAILALSACGGSGGGGGASGTETVGDIIDRYQASFDLGNNINYVTGAEIPTGGSALYLGYAATQVDTRDFGEGVIIGDVSLDISFAGQGNVSGRIDRFNFIDTLDGSDDEPDRSDPATPLSGSLAIANGTIDRTIDGENTGQFSGDINGSIILPASISGVAGQSDAVIEGDLVGFFIEGGVEADLNLRSTIAGQDTVALDGFLVAVEQ